MGLALKLADVAQLQYCVLFFFCSEQILVAGSSALLKPPESKDNDDGEGNRDGDMSQQWECVCYGLGSFSSSVSARYQLAMLLLLLDAKQVGGYVNN